MKLGVLTRYSDLGASSRLRFTQFLPYLRTAGFEVSRQAFFDDAYLHTLYAGKGRNIFSVLKYAAARRRFFRQLPPGTPLLAEYELFPFLPWCMEKSFLKNHPYVLNFDDAVDLHYAKLPVLKNKYPQLITNAVGIITANEVLKEKFSAYNSNVLLLPTVPPEEIKPGLRKSDRLTIVWTGTPVTCKFLLERAEALQMAAKKIDFKLLIVGGNSTIPGVDCQLIPWSEKNEADALSRAHAGIMPLPDTPFARGKSAYKLICYLRAGIPGIASPVGANCQVIRNGHNGFLVSTDREWVNAIAAIADRNIYAGISAEASADGKAYLPQDSAAKLIDFLQKKCHFHA